MRATAEHDPAELVPAKPPAPVLRTAAYWLLAALSLGAAAVHLAMVPPHAQESLLMGLAFAVAGWFQVGFAVAVLVAPRRAWLWPAVAANFVFLATWTTSRTAGLPDWTGDGGTRQAHAADILCAVLEGAVVVGAAVLLAAPRVVERWKIAAPADGDVPVLATHPPCGRRGPGADGQSSVETLIFARDYLVGEVN